MPTKNAAAHPRFRPELEGLRAVAVLAVVLYHAGVPGFSGGFVGVDVFFVLSGYLISQLMLTETQARGGVDLAAFYARRVRRLTPAGLTLVAAVVAAGAAGLWGRAVPDLAESAIGAATYTSNLHFISAAFAYFDAGVERNPLVHTWSLGVEAQFYLVWPLLFVLAGRRRGVLAAAIAALLALSFALCVALTHSNLPLAFYGLPTRLWELAVGALVALAPDPGGARWRGPLAVLGLAAIAASVVLLDRTTLFPGWAAAPPVLGAAAVVLGAGRETAVGRGLASRPLPAIGALSYSWYLWHWPLLAYVALTGPAHAPFWRIGAVAAALGLATASYRFIEQPVRRSQTLSARPLLTLALGAAATALVALGAELGS